MAKKLALRRFDKFNLFFVNFFLTSKYLSWTIQSYASHYQNIEIVLFELFDLIVSYPISNMKMKNWRLMNEYSELEQTVVTVLILILSDFAHCSKNRTEYESIIKHCNVTLIKFSWVN